VEAFVSFQILIAPAQCSGAGRHTLDLCNPAYTGLISPHQISRGASGGFVSGSSIFWVSSTACVPYPANHQPTCQRSATARLRGQVEQM